MNDKKIIERYNIIFSSESGLNKNRNNSEALKEALENGEARVSVVYNNDEEAILESVNELIEQLNSLDPKALKKVAGHIYVTSKKEEMYTEYGVKPKFPTAGYKALAHYEELLKVDSSSKTSTNPILKGVTVHGTLGPKKVELKKRNPFKKIIAIGSVALVLFGVGVGAKKAIDRYNQKPSTQQVQSQKEDPYSTNQKIPNLEFTTTSINEIVEMRNEFFNNAEQFLEMSKKITDSVDKKLEFGINDYIAMYLFYNPEATYGSVSKLVGQSLEFSPSDYTAAKHSVTNKLSVLQYAGVLPTDFFDKVLISDGAKEYAAQMIEYINNGGDVADIKNELNKGINSYPTFTASVFTTYFGVIDRETYGAMTEEANIASDDACSKTNTLFETVLAKIDNELLKEYGSWDNYFSKFNKNYTSVLLDNNEFVEMLDTNPMIKARHGNSGEKGNTDGKGNFGGSYNSSPSSGLPSGGSTSTKVTGVSANEALQAGATQAQIDAANAQIERENAANKAAGYQQAQEVINNNSSIIGTPSETPPPENVTVEETEGAFVPTVPTDANPNVPNPDQATNDWVNAQIAAATDTGSDTNYETGDLVPVAGLAGTSFQNNFVNGIVDNLASNPINTDSNSKGIRR